MAIKSTKLLVIIVFAATFSLLFSSCSQNSKSDIAANTVTNQTSSVENSATATETPEQTSTPKPVETAKPTVKPDQSETVPVSTIKQKQETTAAPNTSRSVQENVTQPTAAVDKVEPKQETVPKQTQGPKPEQTSEPKPEVKL